MTTDYASFPLVVLAGTEEVLVRMIVWEEMEMV